MTRHKKYFPYSDFQNNITTDRLLLNLLSKEDHEFIIQLLNSTGWIEFIGDRNVYTKEEAIAYIDKILTSKNLFYWVVRVKGQSTPMGIISFLKRDYLDNFDIGFAFLPEFNGCGYAFEAAKEMLCIAGKNPKYKTILATTMPGNTKSIKLLLKLGLHFEKGHDLGSGKIHIYSNTSE